jgi:hypothetical protein
VPISALAATRCESVYNPAVVQTRTPLLKKTFHVMKGLLLSPEPHDQRQSRPEDITYTEFKETQRIAREIRNLYPDRAHIYIGLGRSPTPFMAYLKVLGLRNVFNVPLSSMRSHPNRENMPHASGRRYEKALGPALQERLWEHFERFLPPGEMLEGRKIVLIDYAQSGASLVSAQQYISEFYARQGFDVEVIALPIVDQAFSNMLVGALTSVPQISVESQALKNNLQNEFYDRLSEFGKYDLRKTQRAAVEPNEGYAALMAEYAKRLQLQRSQSNSTAP